MSTAPHRGCRERREVRTEVLNDLSGLGSQNSSGRTRGTASACSADREVVQRSLDQRLRAVQLRELVGLELNPRR